ncbi:MAG: hypothetical protein GYA21_01675 [Myxococcales bacterium]|nr:hypothetical protein [Myxococcales bacterium]
MTPAPGGVCAFCGGALDEAIRLDARGACCSACLLSGRVLSGSALRLADVAERLLDVCSTARHMVSSAVEIAEQALRREEYELGRETLRRRAEQALAESRPLLAACLLLRALRIPGQAARVYHDLAATATTLGLTREAGLHLKTGSWLAIKAGDVPLARVMLERLRALDPADEWIAKAEALLPVQAGEEKAEPRCSFCGRTAREAGPLVSGSEAAVCAGCVRKMMNLDRGHN